MARTTVGSVLERYGRGLTGDDAAGMLSRALAGLANPATTRLPAEERDLLIHLSGLPEERKTALAAELGDPEKVDRAQQAAAIEAEVESEAGALDYRQAADILGVNPSSVTRAVAAGRLYAPVVDGRRRFPGWQFVGGKPLPGLPEILPHLASGMHPASLAAIMTGPDEDLGGRSPVGWLAGGGSPARIAALLDALDRW